MARGDLKSQHLRYWGDIRASVSKYANTKELWDNLFAFEQRQQLTRPTGMFDAVVAMRAAAVAIREAADKITKASRETWITFQHIAPEIRARPLGQRAAHPIHLVRFEATVLGETGEETRWMTYKHTGFLNMTKGQLMDILDVQAPALGIGSLEIVTGLTGRLEIVAV